MTYSSGGLIQATDYNFLVQGGTSVDHNVANLNTIWGVGFGDRGYGQDGLLATVDISNTVTATQWATLIARLNAIQTHQTGSATGLTAPVAGGTITFNETLRTLVNTAYASRSSAGIQGTDSLAASSSHSWTSNSPTTFQITCSYTFPDSESARYFFNAGGQLSITFNPVDSLANLKGANWVSFLNSKLSSFRLAGKTSSRTGTGGSVTAQAANTGYWALTTTDAILLSMTSGSAAGAYDSNLIRIKARTNGTQGSNGDNGTVITLTIEFEDIAVDVGSNKGLNLAVTVNSSARRPETSTLPTAIPYPSFAATSITGGGTSTAFNFNEVISTNRTNYNLYSAATAAGWDRVKPLNATVTISQGVAVGSISSAVSAFVIDSTFTAGTTISLINNGGFIVGRGGAGSASAGATAEAGGPALTVGWPTFITNNGVIGGGGGGGGNGSGATAAYLQSSATRAGGGGGGGGAGFNAGTGGPKNGFASGCSGNIRYGMNGADGTLQSGGGGGQSDYTHCGPNAYTYGGYGGGGGNLGQRGATGGEGGVTSECCGYQGIYGWPGLPVGVGGAAGACLTSGSSAKITWLQTGTVLGAFG